MPALRPYRGRLAPSPTGYLHLGHARTFWVAWQRARAARGALVFRNEDLDHQRAKSVFVHAMYEDLRWLGLDWDEGPDTPPQLEKGGRPGNHDAPRRPGAGGPYAPYAQSERRNFYLDCWRRLRDGGFIYPCTCSRKDLEQALSAPHEEKDRGAQPGIAAVQSPIDDELPYPGTCRDKAAISKGYASPAGVSWRFRVPDRETVGFEDNYFGRQEFIAGHEFGDFLLWRRDDIPAYQLAVVADDAAMQITEVVRGADLLKSTARQLLILRALGHTVPSYFHCPLLRDEKNARLAKRHDALSLRTLRENGADPAALREQFAREIDWKRGLGCG